MNGIDKTVLITGASGFLGQIIFNHFTENLNRKVLTLGRQSCNDIAVDLAKNDSIVLPDKIDLIIHAAGKAHAIPRNEYESKAFFEVNFDGTKNLCNSLSEKTAMPSSFVFISTVAVYGLDEGDLINESYPLMGTTPYGQSKIMAEQWLQKWADKNNVTLTILRLPLVVGPNPPGNLGDMIKGIRSGSYFSIGKADAKKSMVYAEDVAAIIPGIIKAGGIYNLTDGYDPTFGELENCISAALKKRKCIKLPISLVEKLALIGDLLGDKFPLNSGKLKKITSTLTFDSSKAKINLGWHPTPVLAILATVI